MFLKFTEILEKLLFFFSYLLLLQGILKLSSWEDLTSFWFVAEPWTVFCMWSVSFFPLPAGVGKTHTETYKEMEGLEMERKGSQMAKTRDWDHGSLHIPSSGLNCF